jgi:hypothetical protein
LLLGLNPAEHRSRDPTCLSPPLCTCSPFPLAFAVYIVPPRNSSNCDPAPTLFPHIYTMRYACEAFRPIRSITHASRRLVINEMPTACTAILANTDGASPPAYIVGVRDDDTTIYDGRDGRLLCEIDWTNDCIHVDEKPISFSDFLQPSSQGR